MTRPYKKRTPGAATLARMEQERQDIRDLMASGLTGSALLQASGMKKTLFYRRLQEVRADTMEPGGLVVPSTAIVPDHAIVNGDSLRTRLLRAIVEAGPFGDARALSRYIRKPLDNYGLHEVMHILFALNKDGLVAMKENTRGQQKDITNIRAQAAAYREMGYATPSVSKDRTDYHNHRSHTTGGPIVRRKVQPEPRQNERPVDDIGVQAEEPQSEAPDPRNPWTAPVATSQSWPVLEALRSRRAQEAKTAKAAELIMQAAELLGDERLLELAADMAGVSLTPAEAEYLAYADAKEK